MSHYYMSTFAHIPNLNLADDGFGNLIWVNKDMYIYNLHFRINTLVYKN